MKPLLLLFISTFLFSQDVTRVSEFKTSAFRGTDCDDTEYRNSNGRPNWKNYGQWLSECDSLSDTYSDSVFAIELNRRAEVRKAEESKRKAEIAELDDLDLDAMWDNTVWEEITDIADEEVYEVEYVTAVAGVRGAEAEDEALLLSLIHI